MTTLTETSTTTLVKMFVKMVFSAAEAEIYRRKVCKGQQDREKHLSAAAGPPAWPHLPDCRIRQRNTVRKVAAPNSPKLQKSQLVGQEVKAPTSEMT